MSCAFSLERTGLGAQGSFHLRPGRGTRGWQEHRGWRGRGRWQDDLHLDAPEVDAGASAERGDPVPRQVASDPDRGAENGRAEAAE